MNLLADMSDIILLSDKLLVGLMNVISRKYLLLLLLFFIRVMEIIPMIIQAMWYDHTILLQVSHLKRDLVHKCHEKTFKTLMT